MVQFHTSRGHWLLRNVPVNNRQLDDFQMSEDARSGCSNWNPFEEHRKTQKCRQFVRFLALRLASQASDVGSIPIARSITSDDSNGLTWLSRPNPAQKWSVLDRSWNELWSIGPKCFRDEICAAHGESAYVCRFQAETLSAHAIVDRDIAPGLRAPTDHVF